VKTLLITTTLFILAGWLHGFADTDLAPDAVKWCDWNGPQVGTSTNFYANGGTFKVAANGDGSLGKGVGEVTFTSNNPDPVAEHQFGNSIWSPTANLALFDGGALAGKTGIELLVNVDPTSTSEKICIKLNASTGDEVYSQTVSIGKGSVQCVQFPLANFRSNKPGGAPLTDFSSLKGTIQITDGWAGYPMPSQATWIIKFSSIYTYGSGGDAPKP